MQCPRKHQLQTIRGLRSNHGSIHTEFGTLYHGAVEELDTRLLAGEESESAICVTLRNLLIASWVPSEPAETEERLNGHPWGGEYVDMWQCTSPAKVRSARVKIWRNSKTGEITADPPAGCAELSFDWEQLPKLIMNTKRCPYAKAPSPEAPVTDLFGDFSCSACGLPALHTREFVPRDKKKNRLNLVRAFMLYADTPESVELYQFPDGTPAVEIQGRIPLPLPSPDGTPYELLVNIDSMVKWEGELAVRERKTTGRSITSKYYWEQFDLDPQIDTYDLFAHLVYSGVDGGELRIMVEAMEIGTGFVRLRRRPIRISKGRREEWFDEIQDMINLIETYARLNYFPRNISACHSGMGSCQFVNVCRRGTEADREEEIEANFQVVRWDPLAGESTSESEAEA